MILNQFGIFGWKEADEDLVLAPLLTGDPLLLIGNHGCAKTHVANKVAQALGRKFLVCDARGAPVGNSSRTLGEGGVGMLGRPGVPFPGNGTVPDHVRRRTWLSQCREAQARRCRVRAESRDHLGQGTGAHRRTEPRGAGTPE